MAPPLRSSKVSYQAGSTRSSESALNRKELPVTLPTLYREVRFRIREAADCRKGLWCRTVGPQQVTHQVQGGFGVESLPFAVELQGDSTSAAKANQADIGTDLCEG